MKIRALAISNMKKSLIIISLLIIIIVLILYFAIFTKKKSSGNFNLNILVRTNEDVNLKKESPNYFTTMDDGCYLLDLSKIEPTHYPDQKKYEWIIPFPEKADCVIQKPPLNLLQKVKSKGGSSAKILGTNNWKIELLYE